MSQLCLAYEKFCVLRDQRRHGEEAPEHTEKRAFELALQDLQSPLHVWIEKTNWMQEQVASFPLVTGMHHRADAMREEINRLGAIEAEAHAALASREAAASVARRGGPQADADRLAKLLEFCTDAKPQFGPRGDLRAMTMKFKNSVETSAGYRRELRKLIDEMQPTPLAALKKKD